MSQVEVDSRPKAIVFMWHGGDSREDECERRFHSVVKPLVESVGFQVSRIKDEIDESQGSWYEGWTVAFQQRLFASTVAVADITGDSTSVGFEVGVALASGLPVICVSDGQAGSAAGWLKQHQIWDLNKQRLLIIARLRKHLRRPALPKTLMRVQNMLSTISKASLQATWTDAVLASAMKRAAERVDQIVEGKRMIRNKNPRIRAREVFERAIQIMEPGDIYCTITRMQFWDVLEDDFLVQNRRAVLDKRITIRRVWLLAPEDRGNAELRDRLRRHVQAEKDCAGRFTNVVREGDLDDLKDKWGHFAILVRGEKLDDPARCMILRPDYGPDSFLGRESPQGLAKAVVDLILSNVADDIRPSIRTVLKDLKIGASSEPKELGIIDLLLSHGDANAEDHVRDFVRRFTEAFTGAPALGEWLAMGGDPASPS